MKLSKNFSLAEIFGSEPADDNQVATAVFMARTILQPLRDYLKAPLTITSGYRSPEHNAVIGGSPTSEHTWHDYSGAVDVSIKDHAQRVYALAWILDKIPYSVGQVIYYLETTHLHISIAAKHQGQFLVCTSKKNHKYMPLKMSELLALDPRLKDVDHA